MPAAPMFDLTVIVDWSANSTPKRGADSIWIAVADRTGLRVDNLRTRREAREHIESLLAAHPGTALVGFDFSFGYPTGFAAAAGLTHGGEAQPWLATWQHLAAHVEDDHRNRNNRWAVAADLNRRLGTNRFWGAPPPRAGTHLTTTRPDGAAPLSLRLTEQCMRSVDDRAPFTAWQLLGAGAVGSQVLMGIPVLHHLRFSSTVRDRVRVWPFETGLVADPCDGRTDAIVLAEVWPSTVALDPADHAVKDAQQVIALARALRSEDQRGALGAAFTPAQAAGHEARVLAEEGWVLSPVRQDSP